MPDDLFIPDSGTGTSTATGTSAAAQDPYFIPDTPAPAPQSQTPETDAVIAAGNTAWNKIVSAAGQVAELARTPSPQWMQPIEQGIRTVAQFNPPGLAESNPLYWGGRYTQWLSQFMPQPLRTLEAAQGAAAVGLTKGVAGMVTPMNVGLALLPGAQEGLAGKAIAGIFL